MDFEFEKLTDRQAIWVLVSNSKSCAKVGKPELAQTFLNRAETIAKAKEKHHHHYRLFDCAVAIKQLGRAEEIASAAGSAKNRLLDKLDIAKYRLGNHKALQNVPRDKLDFFSALEIADAMVDAGEFDTAEKFVSELDIPKEPNDPRTVVAFTYRSIAKKYRDRDDIKNAKKYIDKAMQIGGNLYYSGYGIKIAKRSIYGELKNGLDKFARRGAIHPGHQGRELVMLLSGELIDTAHFKEAKRIRKYLDNEPDRNAVMQRVVVAQANQGNLKDALATIDEIKDDSTKALARLGLAGTLWKKGKSEMATEIAMSEYKTLKNAKRTEKLDKQYQSLANILSVMRRIEEIDEILSQSRNLQQKSNELMNVFIGFADSIPVKSK